MIPETNCGCGSRHRASQALGISCEAGVSLYFKTGPFRPHLPRWLRWVPGWFQGRGWPHTDDRVGTPNPLLTSGEGRGLKTGLSHVAGDVLRPQGAAWGALRWAGTAGAGRDAPIPRDRAGSLSPALTPGPTSTGPGAELCLL